MITISNESGNSRVMAKPLEYVLIKQAWEEGGANVRLHFPEVSVPKAHACAAHIFARRWGPHMPEHLDMEDVDSPTNALVLLKPIRVCTLLSHVSMLSNFFSDIVICLLMLVLLKMWSPTMADIIVRL